MNGLHRTAPFPRICTVDCFVVPSQLPIRKALRNPRSCRFVFELI